MSRSQRLRTALLYLCTDARRERGDLLEFVAAAVAGGVDIVQLRDKGSPGEKQFGALTVVDELELLSALAPIVREGGALLAVNDRADIAVACGADILHLGQDDLPVQAARDIVGPDVIIGLSTHTPEEAVAADQDAEVDYFCTGPLWSTPTKPGRPATGLELVEHAARLGTAKPWFAIGGIDHQRVPDVTHAGATRIVVVRAITQAADPEAAARELKSSW